MMTQKRAKRAALRALRALMAQPGSITQLLNEFHFTKSDFKHKRVVSALLGYPKYPDHIAAILYGALVEQALEQAIVEHFVPEVQRGRELLFSIEEDGALTTFASKVTIGYALGIFDNRMRSDLTWIRQIRNAFAHARADITFATHAITLACNEIGLSSSALGTDINNPRDKFVSTAAILSVYLLQEQPRPLRFINSKLYSELYPPPISS